MTEEVIATEGIEPVAQTEEVKTENLFYDEAKDESQNSDKTETASESSDTSEESESDEVAKVSEDKGETGEADKDIDEKAEVVYDLKLEKDSFLGEAEVKEVQDFAKENSLSPEAAQSILASRDKAVANYVNAQNEASETQINDWGEQVKSDTTMGGDNFNTTVANSKRVLDKFASEGFVNILRETGYGNNPDVVKFLSKVGASMDDDSLIMTGQHGEPKKSTADLFYNNN